MGTAKSGYIQRRIVKVCEDMQVKYDGTVRDTTGKVYQMAYGETGLDPSQTVKVNGKQEACDISRMVAKLNLQYKIKQEKLKKTKKESNIKKEICKEEKDIRGVPIITNKAEIEEFKNKPINMSVDSPPERKVILQEIAKLTGKNRLFRSVSDKGLVRMFKRLSVKD
jgi:D-tyrosyl-tRNA(Tyr) deacylase